MAVQDRPVCFKCDEVIETSAVFCAPCDHDHHSSAVFHPLCLMEWREYRERREAHYRQWVMENQEMILSWLSEARGDGDD